MNPLIPKLTEEQAKRKLARLAQRRGGILTQDGHFCDIPSDEQVVGYGIVEHERLGWVMVSVPRNCNPATVTQNQKEAGYSNIRKAVSNIAHGLDLLSQASEVLGVDIPVSVVLPIADLNRDSDHDTIMQMAASEIDAILLMAQQKDEVTNG